ncbi:DUF2975 domain-containing protein [Mameliella alba]|uniref:DUF2975 domain-containing protein n=1 Tax=Mameliella alba TaxID=561184 RepID=UPI000B529A4F|nr:DUF2975 domain-containing protein [Mameliella alba]MBY6117904.1 DUF2975 domain-containing protein [Mameliella alba]OWV44349.1 hypothetical protein CDZ95_06595 [Mameliella alba]OWV63803.1 hypothetical protein CDZ97_12345 [Mameliella alba]
MTYQLPRATRRAAQVLRGLSFIAMTVLLGLVVWVAVDPAFLVSHRADALGLDMGGRTLGLASRMALVAGAWIALGAVFYTLWHMSRLFACYAGDAALTPTAAHALRQIGLGFLAQAAVGLLGHPVETLLLTLGAPAGQRMVSLAVSSADLGFVLAGGMMLIVGLVTSQAVALRSENEGFV